MECSIISIIFLVLSSIYLASFNFRFFNLKQMLIKTDFSKRYYFFSLKNLPFFSRFRFPIQSFDHIAACSNGSGGGGHGSLAPLQNIHKKRWLIFNVFWPPLFKFSGSATAVPSVFVVNEYCVSFIGVWTQFITQLYQFYPI